MGTVEILDCLQLNQYGTLNHQICLELTHIVSSEVNRNRNFSLY